MRNLAVEIVKRADHAKGFVVEPKRWIVERSIAWFNRCRRPAKDWENRNHNARAFLHLASIRLMLRKLCNPSWSLRTDSKSFFPSLARSLAPQSDNEPAAGPIRRGLNHSMGSPSQ